MTPPNPAKSLWWTTSALADKKSACKGDVSLPFAKIFIIKKTMPHFVSVGWFMKKHVDLSGQWCFSVFTPNSRRLRYTIAKHVEPGA
ncbi:hypothetical protein [Serratia odorifera]|uniref:hypothetical protein n=1 Tax=Serratia odorifera TaxID=618 RepID=UPI0018E86735|nr:hypothetical protein [Serratia odorifera]MBJ2063787.1 hypothetical protein [Serratia odorifera]